MSAKLANDSTAVYLVGGGIASLAAAAFLIRDGNILGKNITILEESPKIGGSLDAAGNSERWVHHARRQNVRKQIRMHVRFVFFDSDIG